MNVCCLFMIMACVHHTGMHMLCACSLSHKSTSLAVKQSAARQCLIKFCLINSKCHMCTVNSLLVRTSIDQPHELPANSDWIIRITMFSCKRRVLIHDIESSMVQVQGVSATCYSSHDSTVHARNRILPSRG